MIDKRFLISHIPAFYFLEVGRIRDEKALIEDLVNYFQSRHDFSEMARDDISLDVNVRECYHIVKKTLDTIEPEYISESIDDFWEGYPEETIGSVRNSVSV